MTTSHLAEAYGRIDQPKEGLSILAEALAIIRSNGEGAYEAELHRQRGELLLLREAQSYPAQGSQDQHEAEACFLKAINIAHQQQAKSLELRATMSLARLWQQQGKHHAARNTLSEIYGWFTEGFDTKDLQEAKALLETLSH